jgi:hypothetical protein
MGHDSKHYYFDLWAEYLTSTLSENVARCQRVNRKVKKVRLNLPGTLNSPNTLKVILDNGLIASLPNQKSNADGSHDINYPYQSPSLMPFDKRSVDPVAKYFCTLARQTDPDFLTDYWSLSVDNSVPSLLRLLALRSVSAMIPKQLQHQGIDFTDDFTVQYFDGDNYLSLSYDAIRQGLLEQIQFYLGNPAIKKQAINSCFKHEHNKNWFNSIL